MTEKNFVIIDGKKFYDDDLDFSDIPIDNGEIGTNEKGSGEKTGSSSGILTSSTLENPMIDFVYGIWSFNLKPFGLKSEKLNLFIDLYKLKKIKDLIFVLNEFQKKQEYYHFNEILTLLNNVTKYYLKKSLKELLLSSPMTKIQWLKELEIEQEEKQDLNVKEEVKDFYLKENKVILKEEQLEQSLINKKEDETNEKQEQMKESVEEDEFDLFGKRTEEELDKDEEIYIFSGCKFKS